MHSWPGGQGVWGFPPSHRNLLQSQTPGFCEYLVWLRTLAMGARTDHRHGPLAAPREVQDLS